MPNVVEAATRFQEVDGFENKTSGAIWNALRICWISVISAPQILSRTKPVKN